MIMQKPSQADIKVINTLARQLVRKLGGHGSIDIRVGVKCNISKGLENTNMNILLVTDDPDWNDTDFYDTIDFSWFIRGFETTTDGRGLFDFYLYDDEGLVCNMQTEFDVKGLVAIHADENKYVWMRG